jgi:hypothetical protein
MDLKPALKKLEESKELNDWRKKNTDAYFSYAFKIPQEMQPDEWQLGYYDTKKDKITTFVLKGNSISIRDEEEIFKKDDAKVLGLDLDKIKVDFDEAVAKAIQFQTRNYPKDKSTKTIAILQNINSGNVWNMTFITEAFNTLNIKIDASSGDILGHNLASIFSFRQKE